MKITYPPVILLCGLIAQVVLYFTFPVLVNLSILFGILILIIGISLVYISLRKLSKIGTIVINKSIPKKKSDIPSNTLKLIEEAEKINN